MLFRSPLSFSFCSSVASVISRVKISCFCSPKSFILIAMIVVVSSSLMLNLPSTIIAAVEGHGSLIVAAHSEDEAAKRGFACAGLGFDHVVAGTPEADLMKPDLRVADGSRLLHAAEHVRQCAG